MYISYDYYRVFYYVARYGNVSQAARLLLNNQPNLTRTIKKLEAELGCPLFSRSRKGMKLTPEGEQLFEHIRIAMEHISAGEAEITEQRSLQSGRTELDRIMRRTNELDTLLQKLYEDYAHGRLPEKRHAKLSAQYEAELVCSGSPISGQAVVYKRGDPEDRGNL